MIRLSHLIDDENVNTDIEESTEVPLEDKIPLVEKYRPEKIDDIMYQDEVKAMFKDALKTGNLPHLLLYGPPGTGKTSSILAAARELFGPLAFRDRTVEMNASDERGINIVRNKIVTISKTTLSTADPSYPSPNYRIIILDEADAMTTEAQSALRKTMEDYSGITRFCFICNYINKIIEPIASRCVKFKFKPLSLESMMGRLKFIAHNEKINITDDCLKDIISVSNGDMRKVITYLQNTKYIPEEITTEAIYEVANCVPLKYLEHIKDICISDKERGLKKIIELSRQIIRSGFPVHSLVNQIQTFIVNSDILTDKKKSLICFIIGDSERKLINGADEYIQILHIFSTIKGVCRGDITEPNPVYLL